MVLKDEKVARPRVKPILKEEKTIKGHVLSYSSFSNMVIGQIARGHTGISNKDIQVDIQCAAILLDISLTNHGFEYAHSGVNKVVHGLVAYYWYGGERLKISAMGAPRWEPKASPYIFIEFDDPRLATKLIASINVNEDTDEKLVDAFVKTIVSEIKNVLSGKENKELVSYG